MATTTRRAQTLVVIGQLSSAQARQKRCILPWPTTVKDVTLTRKATHRLGSVIKRKTYVNTKGLQERTDSGWTSPATLQPADNDDLAACIVLMQNYMNKVGDHGSYTFMVTYDEVSTNALLDDYSGATAAYGLRKLRKRICGQCNSSTQGRPVIANHWVHCTR